jgi:class 3 adenylate cyclase/tetratricopeptide (TPR) repeat protein
MRLGVTPASPRELPDGIVTFLLTDIEGSTPLWESHTAAMSTALARHEALIAEAVASHGGQLIKSRGEGDSTLSVFVRAPDAVTAALALQQVLAIERWSEDLTLPTRVALHSGEAELRDGDYYGQTLNRAARLRALAQGGHVLLSQGTAELVADQLPPGTSLADVGEHYLKGLSRPEHVFALVHPDLGPPPQLRAVTASSAPFVGRDPELGRLDGALEDVLAGAAGGCIMLVSGEAGIGKSALVRRFAEQHAADARFLLGACDPLLTPRALGPLHDIARQTGGRLAALLTAGSPREELFAALQDELDQRARPQVMVVEDAHWADEATLDLLVLLGRRLERTPAMLILTYRDDELAAGHPLLMVLTSLPREAVRRLPLQPLSERATAELARQAGRPVAELRSLTGGNPLLVTEVLAAGEPGVPTTVRDLVLARLTGLPADAKKVVWLVAVVPTRTELWLLEETLGPEPMAVERCAEAGLLVIEEEAVGFRHELLRQAVEGSLSALGRRDLHRRVLQVLSDAQERGVDIARLVHHARQADDADAVLRYAPVAARQAAAVAAHREAVGHYRTALRHADRLSPPVRADLLEGFSVEAYLSGLSGEAVSARKAAVGIREAEGDREKVGEGLRWLSRVSWWAGQRQEAEAAAARAIAVLEAFEPGHQLAMAYSNQSQLDMLAYRTEAALAWASRAIELARRLGDQETLSHALTNVGSARLLEGEQRGRDELEQAFEVAMAAGLEDHAARALVNLAGISTEMRDYPNARADLDRALPFVTKHDLAGYAHYLTGVRGCARLDLGDWAGAEQDARAALAEWEQRRQGGISPVYALVALGRLQARRGDPNAVITLQEARERAFATGELQWVGPVATARAEHAWLRGETERVADEVASAFGLAVEAHHPWFAGELAMRLWQVDALPELPAVAAEPYRLLLAGDWRAAADAWQALGCPYERAQVLAYGDNEAGLEALRLLVRLGASQAAQRVRRQLGAGHPPKARAERLPPIGPE